MKIQVEFVISDKILVSIARQEDGRRWDKRRATKEEVEKIIHKSVEKSLENVDYEVHRDYGAPGHYADLDLARAVGKSVFGDR